MITFTLGHVVILRYDWVDASILPARTASQYNNMIFDVPTVSWSFLVCKIAIKLRESSWTFTRLAPKVLMVSWKLQQNMQAYHLALYLQVSLFLLYVHTKVEESVLFCVESYGFCIIFSCFLLRALVPASPFVLQ